MPWYTRTTWSFLSFAALIAIWWVAAWLAQSDLLPGPPAVWDALQRELARDYLWHLGATLARVTAAFLLAMVIGSAIGIALGTRGAADRFFGGWLTFFLNLPALVTIILCYVWFGLVEAAAILAVAINKVPNVAAMLREGGRALSRDLTEMSRLYELSWTARMRHVVLPQLAPFFAAAARNGLALVWKIVLVVELLGRPNGVGFQIHSLFQLFDVAGILAYALGFIVVVQIIEICVMGPWEQAANRWRR
ncbi:MAG: ABC transporter permease subunit [Pseudomonadota bacterium]